MRFFTKGILRNPRLQPLFLVAIISILLIVTPLSLKTTISKIASYSILYPFVKIDRSLTKIEETSELNSVLNQKLDSLSVLVSTLIENRYENDRLRAMVNFNLNIPYRMIPARVIGLSPTSLYKAIVIDAGEEKGIKRNMAVITPSGIVGKTIATGWRSATVQLLYDPWSKVAATIQANRAHGILRYSGGKYLSLQDVPIEEVVVEGDSVITSGLGGIFPNGLFIGTVIKSEDKGGEIFRDILVKPGANFNSLEEVFVIISPI